MSLKPTCARAEVSVYLEIQSKSRRETAPENTMISRCPKSVLTCFRIAVLLFCTCTGAWAQMVGTLTMADGKVTLIRGTTVYAVAEGAKLAAGDMMQTDAKGQAQVEFQGGPTINFAAGTQALLLNL